VILPDGELVSRAARETPSRDGPDAVVAACISTAIEARERAPSEVGPAVVGIGVSSAGPVDPWRGVIADPPNLGPDFHDVALAAALESAISLPAYLDRDANVAALAEAAFGASRGCDHFVYVTVSTGIGGAIVTGGQLLHGPDGSAGEIGHLTIEMDGPTCGCGGSGHLEAIASGTALARDARAGAAAGLSPYLAGLAVPASSLSAADVAQGEDAGDRFCATLMARARRAFAIACASIVDLLDPARIVVGGSIAAAQGDRLLGPARDEIARSSFRAPAARVRVVPAALGPDVSLVGAQPLVTARLGDPAWRRGRPAPSAHSGA
jgi:glucokinase